MRILADTLPYLHLLARGGGGGSGGGGSGGGGGLGIIAGIGYVPTHFVTAWFNKHASKAAAIIVGSILGLLITVLSFYAGILVGVLVAAGAAFGVYSGVTNLLTRLKKRVQGAKTVMQAAASTDPVWQEAAIDSRIKSVFMNFQSDWSNFNLPNIRTYTTDYYYDHVRLMLTAIYQMGRRNVVANPVLQTAAVVDVKDRPNQADDSFNALVMAQAHDQQIDTVRNQVIYTDDSPFQEFWHFQRVNDQWMLNGISQATENYLQADANLKQFATQNNLYYSLDWGWLLLPQRGQLFGKANFKNSDINNHVIGEWNGLLVQLYTYIPAKNSQRADNYLIGQLNLPKTYGGILIKRRGGINLFNRPPAGYQQVSLEWPDFNQRYDVYATDLERVTSFELLNPNFMARLYDMNLAINIEVVDNLVYFYVRLNKANERYHAMLTVLQMAYQELKR